MEIVYKVVKASLKELVVESEYGNQIHMEIDPERMTESAHKYWIDLSPSTELKFHQKVNDYYHGDSLAAEYHIRDMENWLDPDEDHSLKNILHELANATLGRLLPWFPCKADWDAVKNYLIECAEKAPRGFDLHLLDQYRREAMQAYSWNESDKLVDPRDERLLDLKSHLYQAQVIFSYCSSFEGFPLPRFAYCFSDARTGKQLIRNYLDDPKRILKNMLDYMCIKAGI